jgi:hypothetical protein
MAEPLESIQFDAGELVRQHPPRWRHRNKAAVYEVACSTGYPFEGTIRYARWPAMPLPVSVKERSRVQIHLGVFDYLAGDQDGVWDWHMNFADPHLFVAYDSALLAQDELQVLEHPALGSLRDALRAAGKYPMTVDEGGRATPVTITGVQRRIALDTLPNAGAGRPTGLYGNAFASADLEAVLAAYTPLAPPGITNILALSAPPGGFGTYTRAQIAYVLTAAYSGYKAALCVSREIEGSPVKTMIHTGFWGCGAFGGNRTLMTILQACAADLAGVDLKFYVIDGSGVAVAEEALHLYSKILADNQTTQGILDAVLEQDFPWGVSDGN